MSVPYPAAVQAELDAGRALQARLQTSGGVDLAYGEINKDDGDFAKSPTSATATKMVVTITDETGSTDYTVTLPTPLAVTSGGAGNGISSDGSWHVAKQRIE